MLVLESTNKLFHDSATASFNLKSVIFSVKIGPVSLLQQVFVQKGDNLTLNKFLVILVKNLKINWEYLLLVRFRYAQVMLLVKVNVFFSALGRRWEQAFHLLCFQEFHQCRDLLCCEPWEVRVVLRFRLDFFG